MALTKIDDRGVTYPLALLDNEKIRFGTGNDLELYHDGSNNFIIGTSNTWIKNSGQQGFAAGSDYQVRCTADGTVELFYDNSKKFETTSLGALVTGKLELTGNLVGLTGAFFADSNKASFGNGDDLEIYHNGTNSYIVNGTGNLELQNSTRTIGLKVDNFHVNSGDDQEAIINGEKDGPARLYYNGVKKLETTANGIKVPDGARISAGDSEDVYLYHNGAGSDGAILNTVGSFLIYGSGNNIYLRPENTENSLIAKPNGTVELYYDGTKACYTASNALKFDDNKKAIFGGNLEIYHDGTNSYVNNSTGDLYVQSKSGGDDVYIWSQDDIYLMPQNGENGIRIYGDGAVELFYDDSKKFYTYTEGVKVDGYIKALFDVSDSHWGDNTSNWHHIQNKQDDAHSCIFENSSDSTPYGNLIYFTDCIPDNNTQTFLEGHDTSAIRFKIYSDGDLWNHDNVYTGSDQTLKENIVDATPKLEDLKKLKVRNFNWKAEHFPEKSKKKQLGFIAQEVEEVFPALVSEHDIAPGTPGDGHVPVIKKAIKQAWDPIIIKAMQELIEKVETLETEVAALKAK